MFLYYVLHAPVRLQLWGVHGQLNYETYVRFAAHGSLALYRYSSSAAYMEFIFWGSAAVAALYALGVAPRVTCWLFAVTAYSTVDRNPLAIDSGQNLVVLLAFLLCFADTSSWALLPITARIHSPLVESVASMAHRAARFLITWQMAMVYFWAAYYKLTGSEWRGGTAMYYVLHLERLTVLPALSHAIAGNAIAVMLLTYATLALQAAFPLFIWFRRSKTYLVVGAILLHVGIVVIMGMVTFSATMIVADLSLLSDEQLAQVGLAGRRVLSRLGALRVRWSGS